MRKEFCRTCTGLTVLNYYVSLGYTNNDGIVVGDQFRAARSRVNLDTEITKWLNEKIHQYGSTRSPKEVIRYVCGKEVSAEPLIRYFKEKYTKVYNLG